MKRNILLLAFVFFVILSKAQTKSELQAISLFNKADKSYTNASYDEALDYLNQAEKALGGTNSKLLYLKIQTLNLLYKIDDTKITDLQNAISQFFKITDQVTYPSSKYLEITNIDIELKQHLSEKRQKQEEELSQYNKLKQNGSVTELETFFTEYPNSQYTAELKQIYSAKVFKNKEDANVKWKETNVPLIKKYSAKGKTIVGIGSTSLVAGTALFAYSLFEILRPVNITRTAYEDIGGTVYVQKTYYETGSNAGSNPNFSWATQGALLGTSAILIAAGIALEVKGSYFLHKSIKLKQTAKTQNIDLTYFPSYSIQSQLPQLNLCLKF